MPVIGAGANGATRSGADIRSTSALRIDLPRRKSPGVAAVCRDLVEAGEPDQTVAVWIDGQHCLNIRSLHAFALTAIAEDPSVRLVPYTPHPRAVIGPRVAALLEARRVDRVLRKEYGA